MRLRQFFFHRLIGAALNEAALKKYGELALRMIIPILFMGVVAYALMAPILALESWYYTHDVGRMPYLTEQFRKSFEHGFWFPRWVPELMGGYGYPVFTFYQTGFFFLSLPFTYIFQDVLLAMKVEIFFLLVMGGMGAYLMAREFITSHVLCMFCAMLFMVAPYISINMNPRGAYAELQAQLLIPLAVWLLMRLHRAITTEAETSLRWGIGLALAIAGVIYSHPFTSMFFMPFMALLGLGCYAKTPENFRFLAMFTLSMLLGIVLAAPFWVTVLTMGDQVTLENSHWFYGPSDNWQTFLREYFNPGLPHMIAAGIAFAFNGWRRPFILAAALSYAVFLFLMSSYSNFIWDMHLPIRLIQFPWRINSVAITAQYIIILYGIGRLCQLKLTPKKQLWLLGALCVGLTLTSAWTMFYPEKIIHGKWDSVRRPRYKIYNPINYRERAEGIRMSQFAHLSVGKGDFTPRRVNLTGLYIRPRYNVPLVEIFPDRAGRLSFNDDHNEYRLHFVFRFATNGPINRYTENQNAPPSIIRVPNGPQEHSSVLINQFYLPGWKILVDGKLVPHSGRPADDEDKLVWGPGKNGRIRLNFPTPGVYEVEAWYDGPPGWMLRNLLILIFTVALIAAMHRIPTSTLDERVARLFRRRHKR